MNDITLGIVIPVYHSTVSVAELIEEIGQAFDTVCTYHIYLVDDGNPQETALWLKRRCGALPNVTLIRLKQNYGQQNALLCGLIHSQNCHYVATMDDDLQHDARTLLHLYQTIQNGYEIVYGAPLGEDSQKPFFRLTGSYMRDLLFRFCFGIPSKIKVSSFRIMTGELVREVSSQATGFFYLSAAVFCRPRRAKTCFYQPRSRRYGKSGYTFLKLIKLYGNIIRFYSPAAVLFTSKKRRQAMLYEEVPENCPESKTIMVLGGSNCQLHAVQRARKEGHRVILADYTKNPPAAAYAHVHRQVSTFDISGCIEAAKEERVDAVMTIGTDQPVYTGACVSSELGLPSVLEPQKALAVTNKKVMKQILADKKLPTAAWTLIDRDAGKEDLSFLKGPFVIKPLDSQGKRGIFKCEDISTTLSHLEETLSFSRCSQALVEEYYPGDEITVSGWVTEGDLTILTITDRLLYPDPVHIGICIGHRFPSVHMDQYEEIASISQGVASAFELKEGPFYLQLLIGEEGIKVNELACRIGGAFEDVTIPWLTGFDILKAVMDLSLGRKVDFYKWKGFRCDQVKRCAGVQLLFCRPGTVSDVTPLEKLKELPFVLDCGYNYQVGQTIPAALNATARFGHCVIVGEPENIKESIDEFYRTLQVLSPKGENLASRLYP